MLSKSGIYQIRNTVNGKVYVGSAKLLRKRKREHWRMLRLKEHHSVYLQRAWDKFGPAVFIFEVLHLCDVPDLIAQEQHYIDTLQPAYNISKTAGSRAGTRHSAETRQRMSEIRKGRPTGWVPSSEARERMAAAKRGVKQSEAVRQKKREAMTGRVFSAESIERMCQAQKGRTFSDESRRKMSEGQKRKSTLTLYTYKGKTKSLAEWAAALGMTVAGLYGRIHIRKWPLELALTLPPARSANG